MRVYVRQFNVNPLPDCISSFILFIFYNQQKHLNKLILTASWMKSITNNYSL